VKPYYPIEGERMDRRAFLKTAGAGVVVAGTVIAGAPAAHASKKMRLIT